ncbi:MAG: hypothetical protein GY771_12615 [bacterium]|nr:hypothetical protein [bacterium]
MKMKIDSDYFGMTIEFSYYPGDPGKTYGRPEDCYPPEPAEVEIENISFRSIDIPLANFNEDELDKLNDLCTDAAIDQINADHETRAEYEYDRRQDALHDDY